MHNTSGLTTTVKISLPLLVRDWLVKRCPNQDCYYIREYHDLVWKGTQADNEDTLGSLVVTSKSAHHATFDYIIDITRTEVSVEEPVHKDNRAFIRTRNLQWRAPSFFQQLGKVIKCPH